MTTNQRIKIAKSENTQPDVLRELSKDMEVSVRYRVAENKRTPDNALEELAKDDEEIVRNAVARNRNTPVRTLRELAKEKNIHTQWSLAKNENTPVDVLKQLARNKDNAIRFCVAKNKSTPIMSLKILTNDKTKEVRDAAIKTLENPMTENEAIQQLEFDKDMILFDPSTGEISTLEEIKLRNNDNYNTYIADEIAIKALKEVQKYREIGTVDELSKLKENWQSMNLSVPWRNVGRQWVGMIWNDKNERKITICQR